MTNSEAGRKAFEEWIKTLGEPDDEMNRWFLEKSIKPT